jgi:hypothetical protein
VTFAPKLEGPVWRTCPNPSPWLRLQGRAPLPVFPKPLLSLVREMFNRGRLLKQLARPVLRLWLSLPGLNGSLLPVPSPKNVKARRFTIRVRRALGGLEGSVDQRVASHLHDHYRRTQRTRRFCPVCILRGATGGESATTREPGSVSGPADSPGETEGASPARRFEHYEVILDDDGRPIELGRGAMGVTYKALDVDLFRLKSPDGQDAVTVGIGRTGG